MRQSLAKPGASFLRKLVLVGASVFLLVSFLLVSHEAHAIFGGTDVTYHRSYKTGFVVSIENLKNPMKSCTGTLVHPQVILTAAHCVKTGNQYLSETRVRFGGFQRGQGKIRSITRVLLPDMYLHYEHSSQKKDFQLRYDMALLLLSENAPDTAETVTVAEELPEELDNIWTMGFGVTGGQVYNNQGVQVVVPTGTSMLRRVKLTRDPEARLENWIVSLQQNKGFCFGDSGGPAVVFRDGKWIQVGISSRVTHSGTEACRNRGYFLNLGFIEESGASRSAWIRQGIETLTN